MFYLTAKKPVFIKLNQTFLFSAPREAPSSKHKTLPSSGTKLRVNETGTSRSYAKCQQFDFLSSMNNLQIIAMA